MLGTAWVIQFIRFNVLGIVHIVVFSIILFVSRQMGVNSFLSGAFGYVVVFLIGAFGNIFYVFRSAIKKGFFWTYFIKNALVYISSVTFELFSSHELIPYVQFHTHSEIFVVILQYTIYGFGGIYVFLMNRYLVFGDKTS